METLKVSVEVLLAFLPDILYVGLEAREGLASGVSRLRKAHTKEQTMCELQFVLGHRIGFPTVLITRDDPSRVLRLEALAQSAGENKALWESKPEHDCRVTSNIWV